MSIATLNKVILTVTHVNGLTVTPFSEPFDKDQILNLENLGSNVARFDYQLGGPVKKSITATGYDLIVAGGESGGASVEDITYASLYEKTTTGQLTPGQWYRLTDYKSVNFLNGWQTANNNPTPTDPNFNPQEVYEGETEVLILQATSPYEIAEVGYSETFNGDVVQYEPYTNKIGVDFDLYNGQTLPNEEEVEDFDLKWDGTNVYFNMPEGYPALFGHYFYLYAEFDGGNYYQDGCFEPLTPGASVCQYPYSADDEDFGYPKAVSRIKVEDNGYKVILLDLTEDDFNNYDADSLYVDTVMAVGNAYGCITRRQDTLRNIDCPFDFRGRKYRRFEVDLTPVNPALGLGYWGIGETFLGQATTGNFKDFKIFGDNGYDTYNIEWKDMGGPDAFWYRGYNDNNVFLGSFYYNTVGNSFNFNTVGNSFNYNTVGNSFNYNTVGNNFYYNTVGDNFYSNTVGNSFNYNTVGYSFYLNTVGNYFRLNISNSQVSSLNFTSATHVYGAHECTFIKRQDNTIRLSYYNNSDVLTIVNPTS
jgi:hypothetical protein